MPTDAQVEAAARAMWDVWRVSEIAQPFYRDIEWDWLVSQDQTTVAGKYVAVGRAEARAALVAAGASVLITGAAASLRPTSSPERWELCIQVGQGSPVVHELGLSSLLSLLEQITRIVISRFAGTRGDGEGAR